MSNWEKKIKKNFLLKKTFFSEKAKGPLELFIIVAG